MTEHTTTEGLTEAEKEALRWAIHDHMVFATVERILADRLAAVQAEQDERDALIEHYAAEATRNLYDRKSAEAERDAARREERMRAEDQAKAWRIIARVEALPAEWLADGLANQTKVACARAIRAALDADR